MKEKNIFTIIWKIDAVLILIGGLIAMGVLGYTAYRIYQDVFRSRDVSSMVNIEANTQMSSEWAL
ncbi:MAG: hypothetical protein KAS38_17560, partial [Anaerolineales bacterium]|nr:hypothetical protein [Anaerolineales bacterium]